MFYLTNRYDDQPLLKYMAGFAPPKRHNFQQFKLGEGLVGQCVAERKSILVKNVPPDYRDQLGNRRRPAANILVLPVLFEGDRSRR